MIRQQMEGWYTDPFGRHDARWMSAGTPTNLVRDGEVEGHDEPPDEPWSTTPVEIEDDESSDGEDLKRADDAERDFRHLAETISPFAWPGRLQFWRKK